MDPAIRIRQALLHNASTTQNPGESIICEDCKRPLHNSANSYIHHLTYSTSPRPGYIYIGIKIGMFKGHVPLLFPGDHGCGYKVAGRPGCLFNFNANVRKYNESLPLPLSATFRTVDPRFTLAGQDYMISGERRVPDRRTCLPKVEYNALETAIRQVPEGTPLEMLSLDTAFLYMAWPNLDEVANELHQARERAHLENEEVTDMWNFVDFGDSLPTV
jgi:hypothetical protein